MGVVTNFRCVRLRDGLGLRFRWVVAAMLWVTSRARGL